MDLPFQPAFRVFPWVIFLCFLGVPLGAQVFTQDATGERPGEHFPDDEPRRVQALPDVITPHVRWAKPYAEGRLRALALASRTDGRWPLELAQRLDLDLQVIYAFDSEHLGSSDPGFVAQGPRDQEARLLQALDRPLDVVLFGVSPRLLEEKARKRLRERLEKGTGYVGPLEGLFPEADLKPSARPAQQFVENYVPVRGLRHLRAGPETAEAAAGQALVELYDRRPQGRLAVLQFPRDSEAPPPDRLQVPGLLLMETEAWQSLFCRTVLWAARRDGAEGSWVTDAIATIERSSLPAKLATLEPAACEKAGPEAHVHLSLWDADGRLERDQEIPLAEREVRIPRLPAGDHFYGLWLRQGESVLDWRFGCFTVTSPLRIAEVRLDRRYKRPEEQIQATLTLTADPPVGSRVRLEVLDNFGRAVAMATLPAQREMAFTAPLAASRTIYNYLNARLYDRDGELWHEARQSFYLAQPPLPPDDFALILFGGGGFAPLQQQYLRRYAELGVDACLSSQQGSLDESWEQSLALANLRPLPYLTQLSWEGATEDGRRLGLVLADPDQLAYLEGFLQKQVGLFSRYAPIAYSLGDDQQYVGFGEHDIDWSPPTVADLQRWVQAKYGTIEAVNAAWSTTYRSFSEVQPIRRAEALAAARREENPDFGPLCHWVDHQLHANHLVTQWHARLAKAIQEVDPTARVGYGSIIEGWPSAGRGFDYWDLTEETRLHGQYPNPMFNEICRSAARPESLRGVWFGGYGLYNVWPYEDHEFVPWWEVLHGFNASLLFIAMPDPLVDGNELLAADLGESTGFARTLANVREIRGGIAKLLFNAERQHDGIAILYSPAALHATVADPPLAEDPQWYHLATGAPEYRHMRAHEGMMALLRDAGFSFDYVPSKYLEDGSFLEQRFRLLVLPYMVRISDREAQTIREFVRRGGTVLADFRPGVFDGQMRPSSGVLADVFGVARPAVRPGPVERLLPAQVQPAAWEAASLPTEDLPAEWPNLANVTADPEVIPRGATALGRAGESVPVVLVHRYGEGRALLLNMLLGDYQIWRTMGTELPFRRMVEGLLAGAGLKPAVRAEVKVRQWGRRSLQATEVHRFRREGLEYAGLLRHAKLRVDETVYLADRRPKLATIHFGRAAHVYDVRHHQYRGFTEAIDDLIYPGRAELYALLPYEVRGIEWHTPPTTTPGEGLPYQARLCPEPPDAPVGLHVFHLEVIDPTGHPAREYDANLLAPGGQVAGRVELGLNARPGPWQLTLRDVSSGAIATATIQVKAGIDSLASPGGEGPAWTGPMVDRYQF